VPWRLHRPVRTSNPSNPLKTKRRWVPKATGLAFRSTRKAIRSARCLSFRIVDGASHTPTRPGRPPLDDDGACVDVHPRLPSRQCDETNQRAQREWVTVSEISRRDLRHRRSEVQTASIDNIQALIVNMKRVFKGCPG
jgi:hypothetical protein